MSCSNKPLILLAQAELERNFLKFLSISSENNFLEHLDISKIKNKSICLAIFYEISFNVDLLEKISELFRFHGRKIYSINFHHAIEYRIPNQENDIYLGSYAIEPSDFIDVFPDGCFSSERIFESEDGEVILFAQFSDFALLMLSKNDFDQFLAPTLPSPLVCFQKSMKEGNIPETDQKWLSRLIKKLSPALI